MSQDGATIMRNRRYWRSRIYHELSLIFPKYVHEMAHLPPKRIDEDAGSIATVQNGFEFIHKTFHSCKTTRWTRAHVSLDTSITFKFLRLQGEL